MMRVHENHKCEEKKMRWDLLTGACKSVSSQIIERHERVQY